MKTITGTTGAWITSATKRIGKDDVDDFTFSTSDMSEYGWVKVGIASISIDMFDSKEIVNGQVAMLKEAERRVMAESEKKLNEIRGQIQSLLALPAEV